MPRPAWYLAVQPGGDGGLRQLGSRQGNNLVVSELLRHKVLLAAALSRTGTTCEFEVTLGVGNSLHLKVTWRCNTEEQNCPHDRP